MLFICFPLAIILLSLAFLTDGILDRCVLLFMTALVFCLGFYCYHNSFRILALGQDEIQVFNRKLLRKYFCNHCEKRFENVLIIPVGDATRDERKAIVELIEKHEIKINKGKYDII